MKSILSVFLLLFSCLAYSVPYSPYIVGGAVENQPERYNVVSLTFKSISQYGKSYCTGSLIEPDLVLTAAHCVTEKGKKAFPPLSYVDACFGIETGYDCRAAKSIKWHEKYRPADTTSGKDVAANDIALVRLRNPFYNYSSIPIVRDYELRKGDPVVLKGYGLRVGTDEDDSTGVLRTVESFVDKVDVNRQRFDIFFSESNKRVGACSGDSGGPLYGFLSDGKMAQFGVLSIGLGNATGCLGWNSYTDVRYYVDWVIETAKKM